MIDSAWTEARIVELKRLQALGHSAAEISRALGNVSRSAVIGKIHRLGLQTGRPTRQMARFQALKQRGESAYHSPRAVPQAILHVISPNPKGLVDLADEGECRWPLHEDGEAYLYCGNSCPLHRSYCAGHHEVAYDREATERVRAQPLARARDWSAGYAPRPGRVRSTRPR